MRFDHVILHPLQGSGYYDSLSLGLSELSYSVTFIF